MECWQKQFTWLIVHEHGKSGSCGIFMGSIEYLGDFDELFSRTN